MPRQARMPAAQKLKMQTPQRTFLKIKPVPTLQMMWLNELLALMPKRMRAPKIRRMQHQKLECDLSNRMRVDKPHSMRLCSFFLDYGCLLFEYIEKI